MMVPSPLATSQLWLRYLQPSPHSGRLPGPAREARCSNPACGDELLLSLRLGPGRIEEARFQANGCAATLAAAAALCEALQGCPLEQAHALTTPEALEARLGDLPPNKRHALLLASQAARQALQPLPEESGQ